MYAVPAAAASDVAACNVLKLNAFAEGDSERATSCRDGFKFGEPAPFISDGTVRHVGLKSMYTRGTARDKFCRTDGAE